MHQSSKQTAPASSTFSGQGREILSCDGVTWRTPDGRTVLDSVSFALGREKTALVGDNGVGKTTLARLLVGELESASGIVRRAGRIGRLAQGIETRGRETVAAVLGIESKLKALLAIENGACDPELFEQVGDDWALPSRAQAMLQRLGLPRLDLSSAMAPLSGGEMMRVALAGCLLDEPDLLVLDEPSHHLDRPARHRLYGLLEEFSAGLLVISHDRELLRRMERILELSPSGLRSYGMGWDDYRRQVAVERQAAEERLQAAEQRMQRQRRAAQEARERRQRRAASGKRAAARSGASKIEIQGAKGQAQRTNARLHQMHEKRLAGAREELGVARSQCPELARLRLNLESSGVHSGRFAVAAQGINVRFADGPWLWRNDLDLQLREGGRLALVGANGSGKSTLARVLIADRPPDRGLLRGPAGGETAWLDQNCRVLPAQVPLLEGLLSTHSGLTPQQAYWSLDRFLLGRQAAGRLPSTLSGGERVRAALAHLFGVGRSPRFLVLDEPTHHLDLSTIEVLEQALAAFQGTLILISHDEDFLDAVGVEKRLAVDQL